MNKYSHLFFDLDHTLWDFERNSIEALEEMYAEFELHSLGLTDLKAFVTHYQVVNKLMWDKYRTGTIKKEVLRSQRFIDTLSHFDVNPAIIAEKMASRYLEISPAKKHLRPFAIQLLDSLLGRYDMFIVTNGFKEVQHTKIAASALGKYFSQVVISENVGANKPDRLIFDHCLALAGANATSCLMIGDHLEADVLGARDAGIDQVYYNPERTPHTEKVTYEVTCLSELQEILA